MARKRQRRSVKELSPSLPTPFSACPDAQSCSRVSSGCSHGPTHPSTGSTAPRKHRRAFQGVATVLVADASLQQLKTLTSNMFSTASAVPASRFLLSGLARSSNSRARSARTALTFPPFCSFSFSSQDVDTTHQTRDSNLNSRTYQDHSLAPSVILSSVALGRRDCGGECGSEDFGEHQGGSSTSLCWYEADADAVVDDRAVGTSSTHRRFTLSAASQSPSTPTIRCL